VRILHIITKLDVGGAQTVVAELARHQHDAGHEVLVVTGLVGPAAASLQQTGVQVQHLVSLVHRPLSPQDPKAIRALIKLIRSFRPDVVHTHSSKGGLLGRLAARRAQVPAVYTAHGWPFQPGAPRSQQLQSFVGEWVGARAGGHIVCVSEYERALAIRLRLARPRRISVVANGIEERDVPQRRARQAGEPLNIVTVARLSLPKRIDVLVEAIALSDARMRLVVVGDGELLAETKAVASRVGVTSRVDFVGYEPPDRRLADAHVFALASGYEGMPMTVLEGMRAALPVVATDLPGIAETIGTDAGVLCVNDPAAFAALFQRLADNPIEAGHMGARARQRWEERHTIQHMARAYEQLYGAIVAPPSTRIVADASTTT
jgi:glycosyltransferase involved in cell wall biosynthesis